METVKSFILDVDGALCNGDIPINLEYKNWLMRWAKNKKVYIVTDNSFSKSIQLLGSYLCLSITELHHSCGNGVWSEGTSKRKSKWQASGKALAWLDFELRKSSLSTHVTERIEQRPGMLYASSIGLNPTTKEKIDYIEWDKKHSERTSVVEEFNYTFQDLAARLSGDCGICITEDEKDQRQLVNKIKETNSPIVYIGMRNNDEIINGFRKFDRYFPVNNWQESWKILKTTFDTPNK